LDFKQFENALTFYYDTFNAYPCGDAQPSSGNITYDSSNSSPFLDGEKNGQSLPNCDKEIGPKKGIYTYQYYPVEWPKDPINAMPGSYNPGNYLYGYDVQNDRQLYILYTRLEKNDLLMSSDGGVCNFLYEKGPGLANMTPQLVQWVGEKCN